MASWQYAFLFPGTESSLDPRGAIDVLATFGLEFDHFVHPAFRIDDVGHLEFGEKSHLVGPTLKAIKQRLVHHEQFLVECRNDELFLSCSFATQYSNPFIMLSWSNRLFRRISEARQSQYWDMLGRCANHCRAAYVLFINDPADFFEDKFVEIDGRRFLDRETRFGMNDVLAIWVDRTLCDKLPEGIDLSTGVELPNGFSQWAPLP